MKKQLLLRIFVFRNAARLFPYPKQRLLLLSLLLFSVPAFSQSPGYMGRHFTVGYSLSPVVSIPGDVPRVLLVHSLALNYAIGRRKELAFTTGYSKTANDNGFDESALAFSLALKLYHRTRFAFSPLGPYIKWEALLNQNKILYKSYYDYAYNNYGVVTTHIQRSGGFISYRSIGAAFGFGRQRIFFDRLVLDYGLRFGFTYPLQESATSKNSYERELYSKSSAYFSPFFNVRLGLGFLAF